jgi:hypothetical protein
LSVGDRLSLYLPHDAKSFLGTDSTHIGVDDSFGRVHFAPRKDLREGKRAYAEAFGASPDERKLNSS